MCTVSFVPVKNGFVITSNRDVPASRPLAEAPAVCCEGNARLLYPRDHAGGSWIGVNSNNDVLVLLNGAFEKHEPLAMYKRSRGLVLLELLQHKPCLHWPHLVLDWVEPFTLVVFSGERLYELRWDGDRKHARKLDHKLPHIWSSVTLYDAEATELRKSWFDAWRAKHKTSASSIFNFHSLAGSGDLENGLVINRNNTMKTHSITQVKMESGETSMLYHDLIRETQHLTKLPAVHKKTRSRKLYLRRLRIRLFHWEYWPFAVVYGPLLVYWGWLGVKARSLFFFNAANPSIENGGFVLESKAAIYERMPPAVTPVTVCLRQPLHHDELLSAMQDHQLRFPVVVKPDIGMRGLQVQVVHTEAELEAYRTSSRVDFLLQEYIPYANEVGIFYYRAPDAAKGRITGIVGKELLCVTGDGHATVGELLLATDRGCMQYPALLCAQEELMLYVPAPGEKVFPAPYGNHARGAKFIDLSHLTDDLLISTIDAVCKQVPGFYFGRLDIRYRDWESLRKGEHFAVIELNGAGSEPAHIYDPKHSIFFAWKEILRHWNLMYRAAMTNHRMHNIPFMGWREGVALLRRNTVYIRQLSNE